MRPMLTACAAVLLLWSQPAHAEVTCTNENTAIQASTPTTDFMLQATDGTATHIPTGLVWMRCSLGQTWDGSTCTGTATEFGHWAEALRAVEKINSGASNADNDNAAGFAGKSDWRMPNRNELYSIVESRCWEPAINEAVFPNTPAASSSYWTSTARRFSYGILAVSFTSGDYVGASTGSEFRVRLVRGGP